MKRHHEEGKPSSPKRLRQGYGGSDGRHARQPGHNSQQRPNDNHGRNGAGKSSTHNGNSGSSLKQHQKAQGDSAPNVGVQADALFSMETTLKALVAKKDVAERYFGSHGLEAAQRLLDNLVSQERPATISLDLALPSTVHHTNVSANSTWSLLGGRTTLPRLPGLDPDSPYAQAPFTHKGSVQQHDRQYVSGGDMTYETLEFLGDAYIEIIATRIIFSRYQHFSAGRQSQVREMIVKNETLGMFSEAYGFKERLNIPEQELRHQQELRQQAGKGGKNAQKNKIMADVFEAYVAAVVLSDPENGFRRVEEWLTELWAPILLQHYGPASEEPYNANARAELQQKLGTIATKLEYVEGKPMEQSKHTQKYFITMYFTGFDYQRVLLGKGEGRNKVEASNRAAMAAMVENRKIVEDAAGKVAEMRAENKARREREMAAQVKAEEGN